MERDLNIMKNRSEHTFILLNTSQLEWGRFGASGEERQREFLSAGATGFRFVFLNGIQSSWSHSHYKKCKGVSKLYLEY